MDHVAVFGIGSTNFRYAVATTDGEFLTDVAVSRTRHDELPDQLVAAIGELQGETAHALDSVAVSCTGLVDSAAGAIRELDTPAGETIDRVDVATPVDRAHGLPVKLVNDCNAAALGEWYYGARTDQRCLAHVTFGTGIGGGVVQDGRLVRGNSGQAGEFGLLPIAPHGDYESTGVDGAWEAICSGRGIPEYVAQRASGDESSTDGRAEPETRERFDGSTTAEDVFSAAAAGDDHACDCLDEIARYNAAGIAAICNAVNPGLITIGGGVALNNPDWIVSGIDRYLDRYLFVDRPALQISPLGDDIGLYGALAAVRADTADRSEPSEDATAPGGR
ncbi:ROK family protein [Halosimplex sp. J119]